MKLLYTKMKIFHFKEKLDSLSKENKKILPPIHIRIKPTNVCNHNCYYCAYRVDSIKLGKDMRNRDYIPREKMAEIIEDIQDMGVKAVTFSGGGDPFCYPYLLETAKKLAKTPVKFSALTNGSALQGELAEIFARYATWLRISIDGWDERSYSYYRGVPIEEFARIMKNVKDFKKFGGNCYLGICIIIDRKNAPHLYELISSLKSSGAHSVKMAPCIVSDNARKNNEYHKPIFRQVKKQIARALNKLANKKFEIFDSYYAQLQAFERTYTWCPYLQILPVIGADLNVYACHDKAYDLDKGLIGTIKNHRFKEFWFSNKNKFFRINPSRDCKHHCMVDANNKFILEYLNADKQHLDFV